MEPLIILGMHRSGTSLTANWLHRCGLDLGSKLLEAGVGNAEGHFENEEIVRFHEDLLRNHGYTYLTPNLNRFTITENDLSKAREIIRSSGKEEGWGWKDPRTCLFIRSVWQKVLPKMKVLVIYREPHEVATSIVKRYRKTYFNPFSRRMPWMDIAYIYKERLLLLLGYRQKKMYDAALHAWRIYNEEIIRFLRQCKPADYLVFNVKKFLEHSEYIGNYMVKEWEYGIQPVSAATVFKSHLLDSYPTSSKPYPQDEQFCEIKAELDNYAVKSINRIYEFAPSNHNDPHL